MGLIPDYKHQITNKSHGTRLESGLSAGNRRIDMNLVAILQGISAIDDPAADQHRVTRRFESQNDSQYFIHRDR